MENKVFGITGAFFGAIAVIFGALAAHALKKVLTPDLLSSFETGVKFLMYGSILLLVLFILQSSESLNKNYLKLSGRLVISGTLLFSFSIFLLSTRHVTGIGDAIKAIGLITPLGGMILIAGWVVLGLSFLKK